MPTWLCSFFDLQDEVMQSAVSARARHPSGGYEQRSPMSILEASFLNDSCLSESFNSSSGKTSSVQLTFC